MKIYMAGPLFTFGERIFNRHLRDALQEFGYNVFLPQESEVNGRATFVHKDVALDDERAVLENEILVANLDGSMVDDGTGVEVGIARASRKITIGYRTDFRICGDDPKMKVNLMFNLLDEVIHLSSLAHDDLSMEEFAIKLASLIHEAIQRQVDQRASTAA